MNILSTHPKSHNAAQLKNNCQKTLVIKYGGNAISEETLTSFANDIALLHACQMRVIVVHGGGPQVDEMLTKIGHVSNRIDGMRVTDPTTMQIAEMVLGAGVNGQIVSLINRAAQKGIAVGINGKDAQTLIAEKLNTKVDLGLVGEIVAVDTRLINSLLKDDFLPIIAPIATDKTASITYNINADMAAAAIAKALQADELIMLSNIDGVLDDNKNLIHKLSIKDIQTLIDTGVIYGGMIPKLSGAMDAIKAGVKKVTILNGCTPYAMIDYLLDEKIGTSIVP